MKSIAQARFSRPALWLLVVACILVIPAIVYFVIYDHRNEPLCHKAMMFAATTWLDDRKTDILPNVDGHGEQSLAELRSYLGDDSWPEMYRYVPGMRKGDPGDLVLAYMPVPTRYIFHGEPQTIFAEPKWILVPLDFTGHWCVGLPDDRDIPLAGEQCERVPLEELKSRLKKTLDFLRNNDRPNWQTVVVEHTRFIDSIAKGAN